MYYVIIACTGELYLGSVFSMRFKRLKYFRKMRHRKIRQMLLLLVVMPALLVLLGYLVAAVIILPSMSG